MSLFVSGSNPNNPFALQSLWQQGASSSAPQSQSDPLSSLLAALGQQVTGAAGATNGTSPTGASAPAGSGSMAQQFGSQTLQALLALQANGSDPQSLLSQFAAGGDDATAQQSQQSQQSQGQHGHHHHHHVDFGSNGAGAGPNPMSMLMAADAGASSQTTTNANGSTTTSITYADGSSVSMTTAAAGSTATSSSPPAGGSTGTNNNLIEQLIQMQAQLLTPSSTQTVATA
jgi:hypothetical protein